jgi:hypothetical protein
MGRSEPSATIGRLESFRAHNCTPLPLSSIGVVHLVGVMPIRVHSAGGPGSRPPSFRFILAVLTLGCSLGGAQTTLNDETLEDLLHWSYSAAFGTGFYRVGDEKVFVFKVEPKIPLPWLADRGVDTTLKLPFTFGLQNFDLGEIGDILDLTNNLTMVTFVPGLIFKIPIKGSWELRPFAHYGMGALLSGDERATIHYFGVDSWVALPSIGDFEIHMFNGLQWFGQNPSSGSSDGFVRLVTGFEGNYRMGDLEISGHEIYLKPHFAHYWYFDSLGFGQILDSAVEIKQEFEIGLAVGVEDRISLKVFSFDRLGIAFRGGSEIQGVRLYISSVFQ